MNHNIDLIKMTPTKWRTKLANKCFESVELNFILFVIAVYLFLVLGDFINCSSCWSPGFVFPVFYLSVDCNCHCCCIGLFCSPHQVGLPCLFLHRTYFTVSTSSCHYRNCSLEMIHGKLRTYNKTICSSK